MSKMRVSARKRALNPPPAVSRDLTGHFISQYLESLDCPLATVINQKYTSGEHLALANLAVCPSDYSDPLLFRKDFAAASFLSKSKFLRTNIDKKKVAIAKFLTCERLCAETNRRMMSHRLGYDDPISTHLMFRMGEIISKILGRFDVEGWLDESRWGPGASTLIKRRDADFPTKFRSENGVADTLATALHDCKLLNAYSAWNIKSRSLNLQVGNKVITVPKSAKTDRVIAIEPGLNLWFQLGIGTLIRRRLLKVGIDLNSQRRNQELARKGSLDNSLATVDFSSASDTISKEVVRALFRSDSSRQWLHAMEISRTHKGMIDAKAFYWEKFSSMGNGFTFELETLIFLSAALAVCESLGIPTKEVSVYGDDVIIPSECYAAFEKLTCFLGFTISPQKSFASGSFRESCGEYFFSGVDCKPIFLREKIDRPSEVYKAANAVRTQSHIWGCNLSCDSSLRKPWQLLFFSLPEEWRFCSSAGFVSDSAFIVNLDEALSAPSPATTPRRNKFWIEGFKTPCYQTRVVESKASYDDESLMATRLRYTSTSTTLSGRCIEQGFSFPFSRYRNLESRASSDKRVLGESRRVASILVPSWYNLGPWI